MKKLFFIIIAAFVSIMANAQLPSFDFPLKSANQQLIEDAVGDGLFVVNSRYRLRNIKEKKFYGWGDADYFGETWTLGVKIREGYLLDSRALRPWTDDANFDEYREDKRFEPVLSDPRYRCKSDTACSVFAIENIEYKHVVGGKYQFAADSVFHNCGFQTDNADGQKNGWLVWALAPDSTSADNNLLVYRSEIEFVKGKNSYKTKVAATAKTVLGGVFVTPKVEAIGQITFYLSGIAVEQNGEWRIVRLGGDVAEKAVKKDEKPKQNKKTGLTPIK